MRSTRIGGAVWRGRGGGNGPSPRRPPVHPARAVLLGLALAAAAVEAGAVPVGVPPAGPPLREVAARAGVRIGAAARAALLDSDPRYGAVLAREFDSLTPEVEMKWPRTQPEPERFDFRAADALVDFAEAHGMRVRGHTLLWADPARIPEYVSRAGGAGELRGLLRGHIAGVAGRSRGRLDAWDVVNEPLDPMGGTRLRANVFLEQLGPGYIAEAFRFAREADPSAALFLNEIGVLGGGRKFEALLALVRDLVAEGVPIDGIGLQGHIFAGLNTPSRGGVEQVVRAFADLGLAVELTEIDVSVGPEVPDRRALQARIVGDLLGGCLAVEACRGVTFWGFTDRYSWIDDFLGPGREPLLFDDDYRPKPAVEAVRSALGARAVPEPATLLALGAGLAALGARRRPA